jgi:hypothetical protein
VNTNVNSGMIPGSLEGEMAEASPIKIRIRIGQVEIEYEGTHAFLKEDLPKLLESVLELRAKTPNDSDAPAGGGGSTSPGTVTAVAAKIGGTSGAELVIAAAAKLTLTDKLEKFTRKQLLDAMQTAPSYYKQSYSNNLSKYLKSLQEAGRLTEPSTDTFALTSGEQKALGTKLAG